MSRFTYYLAFAASMLFGRINADCPNEVYQFQGTNDRTMATNVTFLFVPVPKATVQKAVDEAFLILPSKPKLLPIPSEYNVPADQHLVTVTCAFDNDIRQSLLAIDGPLRGCSIMVPFTSTGRTSTPFVSPLINYLSGTSASTNAFLAGLVPAGVSTLLNGITTFVGNMIPMDAAYQYNGLSTTGKQMYSSNAKWALLSNPLSGPGLYPGAVDMFFSPNSSALALSLSQMRNMTNQPYILGFPYNILSPTGIETCQRNTYFTKNQTADVQLREGRVVFGPAGAGGSIFSATLMKGSKDGSGEYGGAVGFSACAQLVGYGTIRGQECEAAARDVDPAAL